MEKEETIYFTAVNSQKQIKNYNHDYWTSWKCIRRLLIISWVLLVAVATFLGTYYLIYLKKEFQPSTQESSETSIQQDGLDAWASKCPKGQVHEAHAFDCYPEDPDVSPLRCVSRGCCWVSEENRQHVNTPRCVYPQNYGYKVHGDVFNTQNGFVVPLTRLLMPHRFGDDIQEVHVLVEMQTSYRLRIKLFDPNNERYEVPVPKIPEDPDDPSHGPSPVRSKLYRVTHTAGTGRPFSLQVRRLDGDATIFDTSAGGLTISHHFLELSSYLASAQIYGLGEHIRGQLQHDMQWRTWSMFADPDSQEGINMQGVHPMYMCLEQSGKAHGVLLLNSNPMEVHLQPIPAITFRTIGGILDFYIFLGPTPEDVVKQYSEAVGRPFMPPYWALGLHLGRQGFYSSEDVQLFLDGLHKNQIRWEVLNLDIDLLQKFALDDDLFTSLPNITSELQRRGQRVLFAIQPGIKGNEPPTRDPAYNIGLQQKVFVTDKWGNTPFIGKRGDDDLVYPDFGKTSCHSWWEDVINRISEDTNFDGLFMTNNEPANDASSDTIGCLNDDLNRPPYVPRIKGKTLYSRTLCMDTTQHWKDEIHSHYNLHNLYGHSMALATDQALRSFGHNERKLLLSRSTFIGSGKYVGHWIEGIKGTWSGMASSIPAVMEFSLFGMPFVGANICGDIKVSSNEDDDSEELCLRWIQLGIFYPFSRLYDFSAGKICEMGKFSREFFRASRFAVQLRSKLLPYLYNLYFLAHTEGSTVMRPLFHEYPMDNNTYNIHHQFMWGAALLITPVLQKSAQDVEMYLPEGLWYDFYTGERLRSSGQWEMKNVPHISSKQPVILHIRAGHIIPLQQPDITTAKSRRNPMHLLVALNSTFQASGSLFWDDGETKDSVAHGEYLLVDFVVSQNTLVVRGHRGKKAFQSNFDNVSINQVTIMGIPRAPNHVAIDDIYVLTGKQYHWNIQTKVLELKHILIPLEDIRIQWRL